MPVITFGVDVCQLCSRGVSVPSGGLPAPNTGDLSEKSGGFSVWVLLSDAADFCVDRSVRTLAGARFFA